MIIRTLKRTGVLSRRLEFRPTHYSRRGLSTAAAPQSTNVTYALDSHPPLFEIPSLPILGSMVPWHSGMTPMDFTRERELLLEQAKQSGYFYSMGIPGYGQGLHGTVYVVSDPREYMKVVRHEGVYPSGLIETLWPMKAGVARVGGDHTAVLPFFGRGTEWKKIRTFLQTDLLSPQSAATYMPGVIKAAQVASKGAPAFADDFNTFLNRCAFDMFSTVMFGELIQSASDPKTSTASQENLDFVEAAVNFLSLDAKLLLDPKEAIANQTFGIQTQTFKTLVEAARVSKQICNDKIRAFEEKYEAGNLNELEQNSYLASALKRFNEQALDGDDTISKEELSAILWMLLTASVDTTSGVLSWALVHIALNPDLQEMIHQELTSNISDKDGALTPDVVNKRAKAPYLYAMLRESHRVTPALTLSINKVVSEEIEIHGQKIPANQKFLFNNYAIQMDPNYVNEPEKFQPERWFAEEVEKRKGTPQELIDHPFFKDPFSQGARKCPGSRVASNEILCFLAQLVLDYKISIPGYDSYEDIPYDLMGTSTALFPKLEFVSREN